MRKRFSTLFGAVLVAALSFAGVGAASAYSPPNAEVAQIFNDTNAARSANGLAPLVLNEQLTSVAQNWTQQQANEGRMYHNPNYSTQVPSGWTKVAENVAAGFTAAGVTEGWMNSPGHKANILGDYDSIGIGVKDGYFTQVFAKYGNVAVTPAPEPAPAPTQPSAPAPVVEAPAPAPAPVVEVPAPVKSSPVVETPDPIEETTPIEQSPVSEEPVTVPENELTEPAPEASIDPNEEMTTQQIDPVSPTDEASEAPAQAVEKAEKSKTLLISLAAGAVLLLAVASFFLIRILRRK